MVTRRHVLPTATSEIQAEMPAVWAVAGAGQGMTAFAEAARANVEIQTAMRKLAAAHT